PAGVLVKVKATVPSSLRIVRAPALCEWPFVAQGGLEFDIWLITCQTRELADLGWRWLLRPAERAFSPTTTTLKHGEVKVLTAVAAAHSVD
ncbi:hypothetical protein, partial [Enterococcus faecalis]|uniref:hypothetical protein n=1 Tax=Enterococcus faecalis TaxID=1351 RepID=UPI003D6B37EA